MRNQVLTAMRMTLALRDQVLVRADHTAFNGAFEGIASGAAVEILGDCGYDLDKLVNLKKFLR